MASTDKKPKGLLTQIKQVFGRKPTEEMGKGCASARAPQGWRASALQPLFSCRVWASGARNLLSATHEAVGGRAFFYVSDTAAPATPPATPLLYAGPQWAAGPVRS